MDTKQQLHLTDEQIAEMCESTVPIKLGNVERSVLQSITDEFRGAEAFNWLKSNDYNIPKVIEPMYTGVDYVGIVSGQVTPRTRMTTLLWHLDCWMENGEILPSATVICSTHFGLEYVSNVDDNLIEYMNRKRRRPDQFTHSRLRIPSRYRVERTQPGKLYFMGPKVVHRTMRAPFSCERTMIKQGICLK